MLTKSISKNSGHFPSERGRTHMNSFPMCIRKMQIRRMGWKDFLSALICLFFSSPQILPHFKLCSWTQCEGKLGQLLQWWFKCSVVAKAPKIKRRSLKPTNKTKCLTSEMSLSYNHRLLSSSLLKLPPVYHAGNEDLAQINLQCILYSF